MRAGLVCIRQILRQYPSRTIYHDALKRRYCIGFTDARGRAASENDEAWGPERIAGVLVTEQGAQFFSVSAGRRDVADWLPTGRRTRINEAESLGALLFLHTFAERLKGCDVLLLLDSMVAEGVLIKNYSTSPYLVSISGAFWHQVGVVDAAVWIGHVPSKANLADDPSRGEYRAADLWGWVGAEVIIPMRTPWARLLAEAESSTAATVVPAQTARRHARQLRAQGR